MMQETLATVAPKPSAATTRQRGRWKLLLVLAICAAPLLASYFMYYVVKPGGRTNYGVLIDPRLHPMPGLAASTLDGAPASLAAYKGKWLMLVVDSGQCADACRKKLFAMRQLRLMQGKEMERIERLWLIDDGVEPAPALLRQFEGMRVLRVAAGPGSQSGSGALRNWLPADAGSSIDKHLYLIDPLGNLMMRFPKDADPAKVKKDLAKLLYASAIG
jgi:hypothetical protein